MQTDCDTHFQVYANSKNKGGKLKLQKGEYTGVLRNILETQYFIVSTTSYLASHCNTAFHSHKNPHICLLIQGSDIECRGDRLPYKRTAGDLFYYEADESHKTIETTINSKNINVEIKVDELRNDGLYPELDFNLNDNDNSSKSIMFKMLQELLNNDGMSTQSLDALAFQLFESDKCKSKPKWVFRIDDYLNDHWAQDFSLKELAKAVSVHPVTISKNFKKYYGCTYGDYRRMLKIQNSISLIKNTDMPLIQIAYTCGFSDQSHFIRNFKKYASFRPNDFRRI